MEFVSTLIDLFLHLDKHLGEIIAQYGVWTYVVLFVIIFCETGLVVTPILPGDSLLFAVGTFAATGALDLGTVLILLSVAAILGDTVNYACGAFIGPKVFRQNSRFLKREYLDRTQRFYERHGGKTIVLARFMPIIRTFAPFVAGIGRMSYPRFLAYNVFGGIIWVLIFVIAGYAFGHLPIVRDHFSLIALGIVIVSVLPIAWEWMRARAEARAAVESQTRV
jgi:membrane-associated protein